MQKKLMYRKTLSNTLRLAFLLLIGLGSIGLWNTTAQDATEEPVVQPLQTCLTVSSTSPAFVFAGQTAILNVSGSDFTATTQVRLLGVDPVLASAFISPTQIQAAIPGDLAVGQYIVEVKDPANLACPTPATSAFEVRAVPPPTTAPQPTVAPTVTSIPTDIPGTPNLLVRSFIANPSTIKPGDTVNFSVEVVNQGSRVAQRISVSIDPGGKFIAAGNQATVILPDIGVGGSFTFNISATAASDTPGGAQPVTLTFSYSDFSGQVYSTKGALTVEVETVAVASQVTLSRYLVNPNPAIPGQPVTITVLLTNTGNDTAQQVLVTVAADGILLAGPQGNSFPVGDIPAGGSASVDMPLIVSGSAKSGPQSQSISISFLQSGENKNINGSMTLDIAKITVPAPIMNLDSYSTGFDYLQPGQRFTLEITLKNIGDAPAGGLSVTFGSVESSSADPTPGAGSSTSVTPSNTFAPLGSGGTQFIGTVEADGEGVTLTQEFIVSGSVDSGVFGLPITLLYTRPDGSSSQTKLSASLVVLVPPQIRITQSAPIPESVNLGDSIVVSLEIANRGRKVVNFTNAVITTENADVLDGAETYLGPVRNDDSTTLNATVIPSAEGEATITVTLNYTDDLNQPKTIEEVYTIQVNPAPPAIDFGPTPDFSQPLPGGEEPQIDNRDLLGRLLLGLLGLGS